jgi:phenylalanyl-tRNA synthetase beta chain
MIVTAMHDMGGKIYSMELEYENGEKMITPDLSPSEKEVDIDYINKRLGLDLSEKDVKKYLEKMGFGYKDGKALIPCYRADILHQCDFVEDVAIAYGYENFEEEIPNVMTIGQESRFEIFKKKISEILIGLGLLEVSTYNITSKELQTTLMECDIEIVELANALNEEYNVMRGWMIPSLMDVFANNKHNEYPQNIFNAGVVFRKDSSYETNTKETVRLAVGLCAEDSDFTKARQVFDYLMRHLDMEYEMRECEHPSFIPGRVARASVNGEDVAYIGEISPSVLHNFDLQMPVAVFELNLSELFLMS